MGQNNSAGRGELSVKLEVRSLKSENEVLKALSDF
jgi:hypothetical protein